MQPSRLRRTTQSPDLLNLDLRLTIGTVFDPRLIDPHLLVEDDLNMAKRCFWASTTLNAIGNDLVSIRGSYDHLFTPAAWEGKHEVFGELFDPQSARSEMYLDMLARFRGSFETEIARMAALIRRVDERRKDIVAQESRRSTLASKIAAKNIQCCDLTGPKDSHPNDRLNLLPSFDLCHQCLRHDEYGSGPRL